MIHTLLALIWATATAACAGLGGAYLAHAFNFRGGEFRGIEADQVGLAVMLLVLAWFIYRFGAKQLLP